MGRANCRRPETQLVHPAHKRSRPLPSNARKLTNSSKASCAQEFRGRNGGAQLAKLIHKLVILALGLLAVGPLSVRAHLPSDSAPQATSQTQPARKDQRQLHHAATNFQLHDNNADLYLAAAAAADLQANGNGNPKPLSGNQTVGGALPASAPGGPASQQSNHGQLHQHQQQLLCPSGLLTFELSTGFIYKPQGAEETLSMMPSTLQLTDCLDYCLHNSSCLAINFEMGLCVLLAASASQNQDSLHSSQFPVFTIYAEKKCLLKDVSQAKLRRRCQRAWTFERVAGYEMKLKPRRKLKFATRELCMDACLLEREFECRSANWFRQTGECQLFDQDRHSVSQSEAGDQQIKGSLLHLYGPHNATGLPAPSQPASGLQPHQHQSPHSNPQPHQNQRPSGVVHHQQYYHTNFQRLSKPEQADAASSGGQQHHHPALANRSRLLGQLDPTLRSAFGPAAAVSSRFGRRLGMAPGGVPSGLGARSWSLPNEAAAVHHYAGPVAAAAANRSHALVDYLENNCVYEPNKLCEFRKIQNKVLKTVDSIYQDVNSLDECRQKCLNAPYRCYSFDYGDTSERVCRTSHLDQASLLSVEEPYLEVMGAITYELAACFNVSIQCRAKTMVAQVSASKAFNGRIYVKSRPTSCLNDVSNALQFELSMAYHDDACDVRASSNQQHGIFSNDIIIQHHDRIVTTQDVGLSVYCQYDLGNRSVTNNVELAIERLPGEEEANSMESKHQQGAASGSHSPFGQQHLTITGLATTVVRSPNVTMRITNMNGQPVTSATVGDRLALLFEIKEKTSPFGIQVREIVAMDGRLGSVGQTQQQNAPASVFHYSSSESSNATGLNPLQLATLNETIATPANSIQFLDTEGCPTDANLMGPLVRMDPHGHRLLAPFDAFKFPASDMVFFRAVVSSCVAECKPAVCQAAGGTDGLLGPRPQAPQGIYGQPAVASNAPGVELLGYEEDVVATTRNMPTTVAAEAAPLTSATAARQQPAATTWPAQKQTLVTSTMAPPMASTERPHAQIGGFDGFDGATPPQLPTSTQARASAAPTTVAPYESAPLSSTLMPTTSTSTSASPAANSRSSPPTAATSAAPPASGSGTANNILHSPAHGGSPQNEDKVAESGDSLTTVAGFSRDQGAAITGSQLNRRSTTVSLPTSPDMVQTTSAPPLNYELPALAANADQLITINVTSNHNLGKPSPRPMTTTTVSLGDEPSEDGGQNRFGPDLQAQFENQSQPTSATTSTATATSANGATALDGQHNRPEAERRRPTKLDPLTAQERQAILDLLSGNDSFDKAPAPLQMALGGDQSQALVAPPQSAASQLYSEETITSGLMKLYPILDSYRHGNSRSRDLPQLASVGQSGGGNYMAQSALSASLSGVARAPISSREVLEEIKLLIANQFSDQQGAMVKQQPSAGLSTTMANNNKTKRSPEDEFAQLSNSLSSRDFVELVNRTLIDYIIAEELKSALITQMLLNEARQTTDGDGDGDGENHNGKQLLQIVGGGSAARQAAARRLTSNGSDDERQQNNGQFVVVGGGREFPRKILQRFVQKMNWPNEVTNSLVSQSTIPIGDDNGDSKQAWPSPSQVRTFKRGLTFDQVERFVKGRLDLELANKIQLALKLLDVNNKRLSDATGELKRNKREVEEQRLKRSTSYVFMSQPQKELESAEVAASANRSLSNSFIAANDHGSFKFVSGHVEIYHTAPVNSISQQQRFRRQTESVLRHPVFESDFESSSTTLSRPADQEPKYELEEMIVQSIKIVDRLQFDDDKGETESRERKREQTAANASASAMDKPSLKQNKLHRKLINANMPSTNKQLANEVDSNQLSAKDDMQLVAASKHRLNAFNIVLVAICFVLVQASMVLLLCFLNWNRQRNNNRKKRSLFANSNQYQQHMTPSSTLDRSTLSSSMAYANCSNSSTLTATTPGRQSSISTSLPGGRSETPASYINSRYIHSMSGSPPTRISNGNLTSTAAYVIHSPYSGTLGRRDERKLLNAGWTLVWPSQASPS